MPVSDFFFEQKCPLFFFLQEKKRLVQVGRFLFKGRNYEQVAYFLQLGDQARDYGLAQQSFFYLLNKSKVFFK
jgi:hypothetical protein